MVKKDLDNTLGIKIISGAKAVRSRINLYLGELNRKTLYEELLFESFCHAIDEAVENHCTEINVKIESKTIEVTYDAGIPLTVNDKSEVVADTFFKYLYSCRNLKKNSEIGSKYCQYGLAVLNTVCKILYVDIIEKNRRGTQTYKKGEATAKFKITPCQQPDRTRLIFEFDEELLGVHDLKLDVLQSKATQLMQELNIKVSFTYSRFKLDRHVFN